MKFDSKRAVELLAENTDRLPVSRLYATLHLVKDAVAVYFLLTQVFKIVELMSSLFASSEFPV